MSSSFISAKIGVAPTCFMHSADDTHVYGVVITSSPSPIPNASKLICNADVQELTATQCSA